MTRYFLIVVEIEGFRGINNEGESVLIGKLGEREPRRVASVAFAFYVVAKASSVATSALSAAVWTGWSVWRRPDGPSRLASLPTSST